MATKSTAKSAKELGAYGDNLQKKTTPGLTTTSKRGKELSAGYFTQPEAEAKRRLKQSYVKWLSTQLGDAKVSYDISDAEIEDLIRVRDQSDLINFDQWIGQLIDLSDPAQAQYLYRIYPDFFEKKQAQVEKNLSLQRKMAEIRNFGARTKEDYYFLYQLQQGQIALPTRPAYQIDSAYDNPEQRKKARGLLNYKRFGKDTPQEWNGRFSDAVGSYTSDMNLIGRLNKRPNMGFTSGSGAY